MPTPLKPALLPLEQYLTAHLPTVVGNVDYQTLKGQLIRIDQILRQGDVERNFIERSLPLHLAKAAQRYQKLAGYQKILQRHAARALRCNIVRVLLQLGFRDMSVRLADSPLLQWFVGIARLDTIKVPSKSTLQRYEQWLPEVELRAVIQELLQLAVQSGSQEVPQPLDLATPVDIGVYFLDMTCVKSNIHWPTDWVLLKDGVHTLMQAVSLIRREGLCHRMDDPKSFQTQINRLCIEMTQGRRKAGAKQKQKRVLRAMKRLTKTVQAHATRHRDLLDKEWESTSWTRKQAEQILQRMDNVLEQLPEAIKQAHERIIGERKVESQKKILSFYETETRVIVRGKAGAEVEFGNTLVMGEADDGLVIDWQLIKDQAPADSHQVVPSLARLNAVFPEQIKGIVTDRGCDSKDNREGLEFMKVKNGICPKKPSDIKVKMADPEFAAWQKRRAQTEARIAIFKREFLGKPLRSKGFAHRELMVSWAVLVHNLWLLAAESEPAKSWPRPPKERPLPLPKKADHSCRTSQVCPKRALRSNSQPLESAKWLSRATFTLGVSLPRKLEKSI